MFSFPQLVISKMEKIKSWLKLTWGTCRYQRISLKEFSKAEVGLNLFTWQGVLFSLMERSMEDLSQLKNQISRLHQMFIQSFLIHDLENVFNFLVSQFSYLHDGLSQMYSAGLRVALSVMGVTHMIWVSVIVSPSQANRLMNYRWVPSVPVQEV